MITYIIFCIIGSTIVSKIAYDRDKGAIAAFIVSLIWSPLVGLIVTLLSKSKKA